MPISVETVTPWASTRPTWALRSAGLSALGQPSGRQRKERKWDARHHVCLSNDHQHPNGRDYFDRYREHGQKPSVPRKRVRPVWTLECPNVETEKHTYRVFDEKLARWKEVVWKVDEEGKELGSEESMPKARSPRSGDDLKLQRERESEWDKGHGVVYSRFNDGIQPNYRSYFDRWKDQDGPDVREPTWRLGVEKRVFLKSSSLPTFHEQQALKKERGWRGC